MTRHGSACSCSRDGAALTEARTIGEYRVLELIATGGMAEVYRARRPGMHDKDLALKIVRADVAGDPSVHRMFVSEARVALALSHINVVQTFEVARHDDGLMLAMELVDGLDLARLAHAHQASLGELLPIRHVISIVADALAGLDYAHRSRRPDGERLELIHRDISPGNILVSHAGEVKVADFGVARSLNRAHKSMDGVLKGKLAYMSPEQVRADPLDKRTDVYSMGVVLYELLTGKRPFAGSTLAIVPDVASGVFPRPRELRSDLPLVLEGIVLKAMRNEPADRFSTAKFMAEALRDAAVELRCFPSQLELGALVERLSAPARKSIPPGGPGPDVTKLETPASKRPSSG